MTQQEIVREIERLPIEEQLRIIALVAHSARRQTQNRKSGATQQSRRGVPIAEVRGIARPSAGHPPNDEEADQIRYDYLMEKCG